MRERIMMINRSLVDPTEGNAIGTLEGYIQLPFAYDIVAISVSPQVDDAGATIDVDDDGTNVITAIDASDQNVPGTWASPGFGGTNAPVHVAKNSKVSFDVNSGAVATAFNVDMVVLVGSA
ncbi:MAG: hypothetical protein GY938_27075 [Ketobacter sp.]|nr:hypothetical protein [Ketobacter sp.]